MIETLEGCCESWDWEKGASLSYRGPRGLCPGGVYSPRGEIDDQ